MAVSMQILIGVSFLIMFLGLSSCYKPSLRFFPSHVTGKWKPFDPDLINCEADELNFSHDLDTIIPVLIKEPSIDPTHQLEGYLCEKTIWVTTCEYTWYFQTTVTHSLKKVLPSAGECMNANEESGVIINVGYFPEPVCWYSSKTETPLEHISIVKESLPADPYTGQVISNHVVDGKCNDTVCITADGLELWIQTGKISSFCAKSITHPGELVRSTDNKTTSIWSPTWGMAEPADLCRMEFCGETGIRTGFEMWFTLASDQNVTPLEISDFERSLPICQEGLKIKTVDQYVNIPSMDLANSVLMYDRCVDAKSLLYEDPSSTNLHMMSRLVGTRPGYGPVLRWCNDHAEINFGTYIYGNVISNPSSNKSIGVDKATGQEIEWGHWCKSIIDGADVWEGPNGIRRVNDTTIYPYHSVDSEAKHLLEMTHKTLNYLKVDTRRPAGPYLLTNIPPGTSRMNLAKEVASGVEWIGDEISSVGMGIVHFITSGSVLIIIIVVLVCCCKRKPEYRGVERREESIPVRLFP